LALAGAVAGFAGLSWARITVEQAKSAANIKK